MDHGSRRAPPRVAALALHYPFASIRLGKDFHFQTVKQARHARKSLAAWGREAGGHLTPSGGVRIAASWIFSANAENRSRPADWQTSCHARSESDCWRWNHR